MGLCLSQYEKQSQKLQMVESASLRISNVEFLSQQASLHSRFLNRTISYTSQEDEMEEYIDRLSKHIPKLDSENLHIPLAWERGSAEACQQIKELELYYPVYSYRLKAEMQARKSTLEGFSQPQIWYIMISIVNGLANLQKARIFSRNVTVEDVRMSSEGLVKIENSLSSPEDYSEAKQSARNCLVSLTDRQIEQTKSLGSILLEMCTYLNVQWRSGKQRQAQQHLDVAFRNIDNQYSQLLRTLISVMLSSSQDRPLPSQIYEIFAPFKKDIMSFKPFNFSIHSMYNSISQSKVHVNNQRISAYLPGYQSQQQHSMHSNRHYQPEQSRVIKMPPYLQSNMDAPLLASSYYHSPLSYQNRYVPYHS